MLHSMLDAQLFMQLSKLYLLFFRHEIPDCPEVLLSLYLPREGHHSRICWLTSGLSNMKRSHYIAFLCDHLTKMRHGCIKIFANFLLLGPGNIECSLQLSTLDSFEKVLDFIAFIHSILAMIHKALDYCVLLLVECDILVLTL